MGELIGALGFAWVRLLIFPGGLAAISASWILEWLMTRRAMPLRDKQLPDGADIAGIVTPLTVISLLPVPPVPTFRYGIDFFVVLMLLELPRFRQIMRSTSPSFTKHEAWILAIRLFAIVSFQQSLGSLRMADLTNAPVGIDPWRIVGSIAWLVALVFDEIWRHREIPATAWEQWGFALRRVGYGAIAVILLLGYMKG